MRDNIMVSVEVLAYNHEKTIARTLESILGQKTQYKFEIVVGEDCSTDDTAKIVREYAEKYPEIIVPLIREKNLGVIENGIDTLGHCSGKYITQCEGDDYWYSDDRLERQVAFMEQNSDYVACVTKCIYLHNGVEEKYPFAAEDSVSVKDMLNNGNVKRYATCTGFYRNIYLEEPELLEHYRGSEVGDLIGATLLICKGKIHYMDYVTGVYEKNDSENGASFSASTMEKQVIEIRKAIETCKLLSGKKYYSEWEKYEATFNRGLYREMCSAVGGRKAWKKIAEELSYKKRFYLVRQLVMDYFEYKKNNRR